MSVSINTAVWMVMCRQPAMRAPVSGLLLPCFLAQCHQAGHFVLGQHDLAAAEIGQGHIGDFVRKAFGGGLGHGEGVGVRE